MSHPGLYSGIRTTVASYIWILPVLESIKRFDYLLLLLLCFIACNHICILPVNIYSSGRQKNGVCFQLTFHNSFFCSLACTLLIAKNELFIDLFGCWQNSIFHNESSRVHVIILPDSANRFLRCILFSLDPSLVILIVTEFYPYLYLWAIFAHCSVAGPFQCLVWSVFVFEYCSIHTPFA